MRPRTVVVDCDPGIDDALALLALAELARRDEVRVALVTTAWGNVPARRTAANARYVLDHSFLSGTPVLAGAGTALSPSPPLADGPDLHGPDGLGGLGPRDDPLWSAGHEAEAIDALAQWMREGATTLSLAPLTNVARALEQLPGGDTAAEIVIMGGAFGSPSGNVTPFAEFNIASDPVAARSVLDSSLNATIVPLDVTQRVAFDADDIAMVADRAINPLVSHLLQANRTLHKQELGIEHFYVHDAVALILMTDPGLMTAARGHVSVATEGEKAGQVSLVEGIPSATVALGISADRAKLQLLDLWVNTPGPEERR